ncbi:MAG: TetR/AcrR family transcriptional regulator [Bacteroidetes bacterium]|nr:TetR/AcrR family transcriptional regulator [Bacteroidota bacterium]
MELERDQKTEEKGLRREILDTSRRLLTTVGYTRLSMRNIANEIGYSATSIYLYFESKDDLVHALIDEGVDLLHSRLAEADQSGTSPEERLEAMCRAYVAFGMERPEYYEIMYVHHPEYIKRYPAEKYRKARRNLEIMAAAIREGMQDGIFRDVEPMLAANLAWTQLHGVVSLLSSERIDKRIDPDELINAACLHVVDAMRRWADTVTDTGH